ncbi:MAG: CotH kinase family protein [Bacteroidaceae bacterium]|nr:CotH kinase family protein [Bacteroidaceae bacterium]
MKRFPTILILLYVAVFCYGQDIPTSTKLSGTPIGSPNVDYSTGRSSETVNTPACAFDGDYGTFYASLDRSRTWVGLDLGTAHVITKVGWSPRTSQARRVQLGVFEGSNNPDFLDAVPLYLIPEQGAANRTDYADVPVTRGFRYVRYVGPADARCNIAELEFYGYEGAGKDSIWYQVTNLPTVSIHTEAGYDPQDKVNEMPSYITITYDGGTRIQEYPITARGRGNASWGFPKKPWRIKFADGKSHHMLKDSPMESPAKAKKWTLINNYGDKTLMRNCLAFEVSKRLQAPYTTWCQPVDVIMNGEYKGCYQLCDQISVDRNRVPITEMTEWDIEEPFVTGGYLIEVDAYASQETSWFNSSRGNPVTIKHPGDDDITTEQHNYIQKHFNLMESALFSSNYTDPEKGFRKYLDPESFLKHFIIGEFSGNMDTYWSTYMYKEREDDHFIVAPCWDFDLAFDNDTRVYPVNGRNDWTFRGGSCAGNMRTFVNRLLSDGGVDQQLNQLWRDNRKEGLLDEKTLVAYVDSMAQEIEASANLNFIRWPILNTMVHQNVSALGSFEAEVDVLRNYIPTRLAWIDNYLGYDPGTLYTDSTYYISTPEQLIEFSQVVAGGAQYSNAYLEADIDMEGYSDEFKPIGTSGHTFRGSFDGQGHRIKNLHISGGDYSGLFGAVSGGAKISNLVLDASCTISGSNYVGLAGGSMGAGNVTFSCVGNEAAVTATGANAAGIIGCNKGSGCIFSLQDCYNTGDIKGSSESAAISGWVGTNASIQNCYNIGTVTGYSYRNDFYRGSATALNCYSTSTTQVNRTTLEDAESGKLCYSLNSGKTLEPVWYQTIGEDSYPIFDASHLVVLKSDDGTYYNVSNLAGDVNSNGVLDETDALWIASYLAGETPEGFEVINADANLDSHINVADVVTVRRLLSETPLGKESLTADLYSSNASVKAGGTRKVTVWLNTSRPATAYEADIELSDGLSVKEGSVAFSTKINTSTHIAQAIPTDGGIHLLVYEPANGNFAGTTGTALTFTIAGGEQFAGGTYMIKNQCIVTADGVACNPDDDSYDVSLAKTYVTSIQLEPTDIDMIAGTDTVLSVLILPETATIKELGWLTSDANVATVADGVISAIAEGTATITAKAIDGSNKQASVVVTVYRDADGIAYPMAETEGQDIFTLSGTRIERITKTGIYIVNGKKKFVIKK